MRPIGRIFGVIRKEVVELLRQPALLAILVIGPLAILFIFGTGVKSYDPVVDAIFVAPEGNEAVQELVAEFAESQNRRLRIVDITTDAQDGRDRLRNGEVQMMVTVPNIDVDGLLQAEERQEILVEHTFLDPLEAQAMRLFTKGAVDDLNSLFVAQAIAQSQSIAADLLASDTAGRLDELATDLDSSDVDEARMRAEELIGQDPTFLSSPLRGDATPLGGAVSNSTYYAPAVVALILQHLTLTFVALSVSRERLQGTTELLNISPLTPFERVLGKVLAYLLIGVVLGAVLVAAVVLLLGAPIRGGSAALAPILALEIIASIGIGLILAGIARTTTQVVQGGMLILLTSVFFGGLVLSSDRLFDWVKPVSWVLPMSHAITLLRQSMLRGAGLSVEPMAALIAIATVTLSVGSWLTIRSERAG